MHLSISNIAKNMAAILIGCFIALILAELILRVFNPFPSRIRGDKIQLKVNYEKTISINPPIEGLDDKIHYSVNSLGFRGDEPPENFDDHFTIFTVGGSTTECSLLANEKTWSELLYQKLKKHNENIWMNNAGLDGCSSYGHNIMLDDYLLRLKPDMILFMVGANDKGKASFDNEDGFMIDRKESLVRKLIKQVEIASLINNLYESYKTKKVDLGHNLMTAKEIKAREDAELKKNLADITYLEEERQLLSFHRNYMPQYRSRVETMLNKCLDNNIEPVLITQSLVNDEQSTDWKIMEIYNDEIKKIALEKNLFVIDLGNKLEKEVSYFYDSMHFTNLGSERVAEILYDEMKQYLVDKKVIFDHRQTKLSYKSHS